MVARHGTDPPLRDMTGKDGMDQRKRIAQEERCGHVMRTESCTPCSRNSSREASSCLGQALVTQEGGLDPLLRYSGKAARAP